MWGTFYVLRTEAYLHAKEILETDDRGTEEMEAARLSLIDPASDPWKLASRVADLGLEARLRVCSEIIMLHQGKVHIAEDIWLVTESLPRMPHRERKRNR